MALNYKLLQIGLEQHRVVVLLYYPQPLNLVITSVCLFLTCFSHPYTHTTTVVIMDDSYQLCTALFTHATVVITDNTLPAWFDDPLRAQTHRRS